MRGKFITLEGTEGSGKSTQTKLLAEYLTKTKQPFIITREPGGDEVAEKIRDIILDAKNSTMTFETEALLYAASRAQHVKHTVLPNLEKGNTVFCDRYVHSSIVYQGFGRELGFDFVNAINSYAINACPPDYTILLNLKPSEGFLRKGGEDKKDRIETSGEEFFKRVQQGYDYLSGLGDKIINIDPVGSIEEVHQRILQALRERNLIK